MKSMILPLLALLTILAACANRPESIHASFVSHEKFTHLNCTELDAAMAETISELEAYYKRQHSKANLDAFFIFLHFPVSKLTGDFEGEIARLKGQVEAIETAQIKNGCTEANQTQATNPQEQ
jgi:hypothetical protein